jgi:hypothetical protein
MHAQTIGRIALPQGRVAGAGSRAPALAPVRGALLGSVFGSACWALFATLTWLALQS